MLYISSPAIKVQILEDHKIIIMTNHRLMFTHVDFIEQYISMPLISPEPLTFYHSTECLQTLVQSKSTIEIYHCDWKTSASLLRVLLLNQEKVDGIFYSLNGWNICGINLQYQPAKIHFYPSLSAQRHGSKGEDQKQQLAECIIGCSLYKFYPTKLLKISYEPSSPYSQNHTKKQNQVHWKDMLMVLKNNSYNIDIQGRKAPQNRDIIAINQNYLLIIHNYQVLITLDYLNIFYFNEQLLIKIDPNQNQLILNQIDYMHNRLNRVGRFPDLYGHICCTKIVNNDQLVILEYTEQEIIVTCLALERNREQMLEYTKKGEDFVNKDVVITERSRESMRNQDSVEVVRGRRESNQGNSSQDYGQGVKLEESHDKQVGNHGKKWLAEDESEINEVGQDQDDYFPNSKISQNKKSKISIQSNDMQVMSKKIECFKPQGMNLTTSKMNQIQTAHYCKLLQNLLQQSPQKFYDLLHQFLLQVLEQPQAPFFLATTLRTHNPQFTKQKIKTVFRDLIGQQMYKQKCTHGLQQFKITQVPQQCLNFPQSFITAIRTLNRDTYIGDLLTPNQGTFEQILQSYFNIDMNDSQPIIIIQDQQIDIRHPRNILNILLYLNEELKINLQSLFRVYCTKLLKYHKFQIMYAMVEENVLNICGVDRLFLDQLLKQTFVMHIQHPLQNYAILIHIVQLFPQNLLNQYKIKLTLIVQLANNQLTYNLTDIFELCINRSSSVSHCIQKIINENCCENLVKLRIDFLYLSLCWLQDGHKLLYYTREYVDIVKMLAEKFVQERMLRQGFQLLDKILSKIAVWEIARLLKMYVGDIYMNRLIQCKLEDINSLSDIFPEFYHQTYKQLKKDKLNPPQFSSSLSCSWSKFLQTFNKNLKGSLQLKIFTYCDFSNAYKLFQTMPEQIKIDFQKFFEEIQEYLIISMQQLQQNNNQMILDPKQSLSIPFSHFKPQNNNLAQSIDHDDMLSDYHPLHNNKNKKNPAKSLGIIDQYSQNSFASLKKPKSHYALTDSIIMQYQQLQQLKLLTNKQQIINALNDIYNTCDKQLFLKSLQYVDLQKIEIPNLKSYRVLCAQINDIAIERIVPFGVLMSRDRSKNYEIMSQGIQEELCMEYFWDIYKIFEKFTGKEIEIAKMMVRKIVEINKNDSESDFTQEILICTQLKAHKPFIEQMRKKAQKEKLTKILKKLAY